MNESTTDRIIRVILGVVLLVVAIWAMTGFWAWVVGIVGAVLLITGLTGFCAIYKIFGTGTKKPGHQV